MHWPPNIFPYILHPLLPIVGLFISIVFQIIGLKNFSSLNFYTSVLFGFFWGLLTLIGFEIYLTFFQNNFNSDFLAIGFINFFCYLIMQICYFLLINMGMSALRVRVLEELNQSYNGLTMDEIVERYSSKEIVQKRIDKLTAAKQIFIQGNRCFINKKSVLLVAKFYDTMKLIIFGKKFQRI